MSRIFLFRLNSPVEFQPKMDFGRKNLESYHTSFERYFNQLFENELFQTVSFREKKLKEKRKAR